jgi:hypothetical protein
MVPLPQWCDVDTRQQHRLRGEALDPHGIRQRPRSAASPSGRPDGDQRVDGQHRQTRHRYS